MSKPPEPRPKAPDLILPGTVIRTGGKVALLPPWNITLDARIYNDANHASAVRRQRELDAASRSKRPFPGAAAEERDNLLTALRASAPKLPPGPIMRFLGRLFSGRKGA